MDPNEALKNMRDGAACVRNAADLLELEPAAEGLADAVAALDEWITRGGFLPADWMPPGLNGAPEDQRAAYRLETVFDRALRDDEQLDRAFLKDGGEIHHLRGRLIRLLAMAVVTEAQAHRAMVERMLTRSALSSSAPLPPLHPM